MASVRFADMQFRPVEFLDFTSLTLDEFQQLPALRGRIPSPYGGVVPRWEAADGPPFQRVPELSPANP